MNGIVVEHSFIFVHSIEPRVYKFAFCISHHSNANAFSKQNFLSRSEVEQPVVPFNVIVPVIKMFLICQQSSKFDKLATKHRSTDVACMGVSYISDPSFLSSSRKKKSSNVDKDNSSSMTQEGSSSYFMGTNSERRELAMLVAIDRIDQVTCEKTKYLSEIAERVIAIGNLATERHAKSLNTKKRSGINPVMAGIYRKQVVQGMKRIKALEIEYAYIQKILRSLNQLKFKIEADLTKPADVEDNIRDIISMARKTEIPEYDEAKLIAELEARSYLNYKP